MLQQEIEKFVSNPRKLFLIDGIGALLSAFLLGVVLIQFESYFGIPKSTLYFLASLPIFFAAYDFYCYRQTKDKSGQFLRIIAIINMLYCVLSIVCALFHLEVITFLGWTYILVEILIVLSLALVELKVANRILKSN